jgi:ubiquinone/menaquinone biosynthesis C-methylase UbiE
LEAEKEPKSDQELAFLRDLYVMPDWGERFATLIDDNIELPKKGRILYVQSGTGGHAMAIQEVLDSDVQLVCVDESNECLELARAKAMAVHGETDFRQSPANDLPFDFDDFDLVIADLSLVPPTRLPAIYTELARVTKPGGAVAVAVTTAGSFGEFFSIYWEAMANAGLAHDTAIFDELITCLPTISKVEELAGQAGLGDILSRTGPEEFEYESGEAFLNSPLITEFLLPVWIAPVPAAEREKVLTEIAKVIDEERHEADFVMSVKATLVSGKKRGSVSK